MLYHYLPESHMKLHYYACNGVHTLDIFQTLQSSARPSADPVNEAINSWKLCRRCSNHEFENDEKIAYGYDLENEICCKLQNKRLMIYGGKTILGGGSLGVFSPVIG